MSKFLRLLRALVLLLLLAGCAIAARGWLAEHPQHNPSVPLDLRDERGWATAAKLRAIADDIPACRAVLTRSEVNFTALPPATQGECSRPDRLTLDDAPLRPDDPQITCPVAAGLTLWIEHDVQRLARSILGYEVVAIEQMGTYNCRRMYGAQEGRWSEHATGNAIDIGGFVLTDGRRIRVISDWDGESEEAQFLRAVRDAACNSFSTVLSPDYNTAHADHFHFDQTDRIGGFGVCR